jgi:hypothetical protein
VLVDLPRHCAPITSVELDYGDPELRRHDRTPARLQIVPRQTEARYGYEEPRYEQPRYEQPRVRPSRYTIVRPRASTWSVQGSFRF